MKIDKSEILLESNENSVVLNIISNDKWVINSNVDWLILDKTTGYRNGEVVIGRDYNETDEDGVGIITITVGDVSKTCVVTASKIEIHEVGDVMIWDNVRNKKVFIKPDDLNVNDYPSERFTPIGVVAIPSSHDVYGNGECGVISLKFMDYSNPDNGSVNTKTMYWGGRGKDISELNTLTQIPLISTALTSNEITGVTYAGYLPSTKFTSNKPAAGNGLDTLAGYSGKTSYAPSPYLEGSSRNPSYYTTDTTKYPGLSANCFSDFNGKSNTEIILNYATKQTDWRTASAITHSSSAGYYPAACCAWRYHTPGTNQGDWYLPSAGEMGYVIVRLNEINSSINKINTIYGSDIAVTIPSVYLWSSSEYSSDYAWYLYADNGYTFGKYYKSNVSNVRGFFRIY